MRKSKGPAQLRIFSLVLVMLFVIGSITIPASAEDSQGVPSSAEQEQQKEEALETTPETPDSASSACTTGDEADTNDVLGVEQQEDAVSPEEEQQENLIMSEDVQQEEQSMTETDPEDESISENMPDEDSSAQTTEQMTQEDPPAQQIADTEESPSNTASELSPSWSLQVPINLEVSYGAAEMTLKTATVTGVENLGDKTIHLCLTSDCVFTGNSEKMSVSILVDGVPVTPGQETVFGTATDSGVSYAQVTIVFSDEGWRALSSGSYSMAISYNSYIE